MSPETNVSMASASSLSAGHITTNTVLSWLEGLQACDGWGTVGWSEMCGWGWEHLINAAIRVFVVVALSAVVSKALHCLASPVLRLDQKLQESGRV